MIGGAVTSGIWGLGVKGVDLEDSGIMRVWMKAFARLMGLASRPPL